MPGAPCYRVAMMKHEVVYEGAEAGHHRGRRVARTVRGSDPPRGPRGRLRPSLGPGRRAVRRLVAGPPAAAGGTSLPAGHGVHAQRHLHGVGCDRQRHQGGHAPRRRVHQRLAGGQQDPRGIGQRELGLVVRVVRFIAPRSGLQPFEQVRRRPQDQAVVRRHRPARLSDRSNRPYDRPEGCPGRDGSRPGGQGARHPGLEGHRVVDLERLPRDLARRTAPGRAARCRVLLRRRGGGGRHQDGSAHRNEPRRRLHHHRPQPCTA